MIRIQRVDLPANLHARLRRSTAELRDSGAGAETARERWRGARATRSALRERLATMAAGIDRCMYCGDSLGTAIDHFEPLAQAPLRTFDWDNHLLACSYCNSHGKRELFPRGDDGSPMLIDPSAEDPYSHLDLLLSVGEYSARTPKGETTIDVFGLNRADLVRGRQSAFVRTKCMLRDRGRFSAMEATEQVDEITIALREQPFADVLSAMLRYRNRPGAETVLGGRDVIEALADPDLDFWG